MTQYVLVRHSAYALAANPAFEEALETAEVDTVRAYAVRAVGATLYPSREAAEAAIPGARGYFSHVRIGGAEVFVTTP